MLGGVAFIDYDLDGDPDLFAVNGHSDSMLARDPGREGDRLFRNDGRGRFEDVTAAAGGGDARYGFGAAVGDYDNDGDPDLLVTNFGRNTLYRNGGDGRFADITGAAGLREEGFNTSAAWADLDRDGDLDLYIARYLRYRPGTSRRCSEGGVPVYCHPSLFPGEPDLLYLNRGDGTFREIGEAAGIGRGGEDEGKGLGVVAFDYDRDGWLDVFVANDGTPNYLFRNRGNLTFSEEAQAMGVALSAEGRALAGMGVDLGDVDGDGQTDLHITNFSHELESLYFNRGANGFEDRARRNGLESTFLTLGFGTLFLDLDLDGDEDLVTANGHFDDLIDSSPRRNGTSYRQRPGLFLNRGDGRFEEAAARGGPFFAEAVVGRGLARADI